MKLYYSPDLYDLLSNIDNKVSKFLIDLYDTNVFNSEINLLDIDKKNLGCLTFTKNYKNLNIDHDYIISSYLDMHSIWTKGRNSIKIGKFIQRFQRFSNKEIEDFVNIFKSLIHINSETIELVSGDEIRKWYLEDNYHSYNGTLGSSCMRYEECQEYLDIYVKNPNTCRLLIVKKNNKLVARALVWKVSKVNEPIKRNRKISSLKSKLLNQYQNDEYIIDKFYYSADHYYNVMENYAKKNNWIIRKYNKMCGVYISEEKKYIEYYLDIEIKVNSLEFKKYPYMDTFTRYDSRKGVLFNDQDNLKIGHILNRTNGAYQQSMTKFESIKLYIGSLLDSILDF